MPLQPKRTAKRALPAGSTLPRGLYPGAQCLELPRRAAVRSSIGGPSPSRGESILSRGPAHGEICQTGMPIAPGCRECAQRYWRRRHRRRRHWRRRHLRRCRLGRSWKSSFGRGVRLRVSRGSMRLLGCQQTNCHSFFAQEPAAPAVHAIDAIVPVAARGHGRSGLCPALLGRGFGKAWSLRELLGRGSATCCIER